MAQRDRVPSSKSSAGASPFEDAWGDGNKGTINDVESLRKGLIKTSKDKTKAPHTILVIGETGVGKSSVSELLANVLVGNDADRYNFDVLEHTNEQSGPANQSQTNTARIYELTSKNGVVVRILDTPGLAHTRSPEQDELHNKIIETQIKTHIKFVSAVLVLANGTVPQVTAGTRRALSFLSTIVPKTQANNIAFVFTNVSSMIYLNFPQHTIPEVLKDAPQFLLDNPIALQRKYHRLMDDPSMKKRRTDFRRAVKATEQETLTVLVDLFDWLDGLEPQPMTDETLISTTRAAAKEATSYAVSY